MKKLRSHHPMCENRSFATAQVDLSHETALCSRSGTIAEHNASSTPLTSIEDKDHHSSSTPLTSIEDKDHHSSSTPLTSIEDKDYHSSSTPPTSSEDQDYHSSSTPLTSIEDKDYHSSSTPPTSSEDKDYHSSSTPLTSIEDKDYHSSSTPPTSSEDEDYHSPSTSPTSSEDQDYHPSSTPPTSSEDEDYHPSSTPPTSSEDEDYHPSIPSSTERESVSEKDHIHSSLREHEILEAETIANSELKGKRKLQGDKKRPQVTIQTSQKKTDGTRAWDKAHYCLYCTKSNLKMARHLQRKHSNETDVARAFSFRPGSKQRKTLLESLRNKGDWQHNIKVLEEGNGEIVTWRQPTEKASVQDYLPCEHCYAMFKRTELWRHGRSCGERNRETEKGKRRRVQKASSQLLPIMESAGGVTKVIHTMLQDNVTSHIRSDEMICKYGDALFARKGREQSQHGYIAQKLRELGRFVLAAKKIDKSVKSLKDICDPTKFDLAVKAARRVSNYNTETNEYGKPSTAVKIGFSLKGATETWIGHCLMTSDVLTEKRAKKFKQLLDSSWSTFVSTNAHSTMEQRRWNKEDSVPLTKAVVTLQNYLRKIEDEAKVELKKCASNTTAYKKLTESLLAQIIVFNKKREGEASRLTLETYLKADTGPVNEDIYETLSAVEKQLSHRLTRIVTRGKRGRKVPILLLDRTKTSLDFMIEKRKEVGVIDDNPFLFARIGTETNIRGCDCLRKYAKESKASHPELLRSTKLRKHVATLCQLLDLDNQELEQVARFMGHDIRVHCDYYRQTDKTFQVAKIGKLLLAMEHGAGALKGKNLKTLDSVVFGHEATSTKGLRGVKERGTSNVDRRLEANDDGEQPHLSTTSPPVKRPTKTATKRHDDDGSYDDGGRSRHCIHQ
ncbi:uncharacterized protein LOC132451691 isoform X2 [Gadus macrocephalus]|uniref:uncharacterized protein LOC132451691 isoform X2 n=1 Tax=Gadus macrocephalus TaxID=80720 RepID=UPI0028CB360D|nr:uncharacterized protein LOC132451691 isoform X2 [Gadus macrocephalus]